MSKTLRTSVIIGGALAGSLRSAMRDTKSGLSQIGEAAASVARRQKLLGQSIQTFGRMGKNVDGLRRQYADLVREAERLRVAQVRLAAVNSRIAANNLARVEVGGKLRGAAIQFGIVAAATVVPIRKAAQFETAMLGVAKQVDGARDAAGNLTPIYFDMQRRIQGLGRTIPIATNELADMAAAGARMGVARDQLIDFTRTSAAMADALELPGAQLADDMGKIAGLFAIPIPRIGELADAINFLDDSALSKGGDIVEVMRRIGGMAAAVKLPASEAAALGSTFLSLGSSAEVAGTSTNALLRILGTATAQSKKVRKALAAAGLDAGTVQTGISRDATGTILAVLDKLNSLPDEQRLVSTTQIFGAEFGDDIAKLAGGTAEFRRELELVRSAQAKGSVDREFQARIKTTNAQWQITKNRAEEIAVAVGGALLPAVNDLFTAVTPMVQTFAKLAQENPKFVKGIVGAALAFTGMKVAALAARFALLSIKGPALAALGIVARLRVGALLGGKGLLRGKGMGGIAGAAAAAATGASATPVFVTNWAQAGGLGGGLGDAGKGIAGGVATKAKGAFAALRTGVAALVATGTTSLTGLAATGATGIATIVAGVAVAGVAGFSVGTAIEQRAQKHEKGRENLDRIGRNMAQLAALFGSDDAKRALAVSEPIRRERDAERLAQFYAGERTRQLSKQGGFGSRGRGGARRSAGGEAARVARDTATVQAFRKDAPKAAAFRALNGEQAFGPATGSRGRGGARRSAGGEAARVQNNTWNITQQAGESGEALARRIIAEQKLADAAAERGRLRDGAG